MKREIYFNLALDVVNIKMMQLRKLKNAATVRGFTYLVSFYTNETNWKSWFEMIHPQFFNEEQVK